MEAVAVNGLQLPPLFVELIQNDRWRHPGDSILTQLIPFLREPVDFLSRVDSITRETNGLVKLANEPRWEQLFHTKRSSKCREAIELPWLDADSAILIAVNRVAGDDTGIALDFRTQAIDPRVVASEWHEGPEGCVWREVAETFSHFVELLGI